jgi:hypothetical protein
MAFTARRPLIGALAFSLVCGTGPRWSDATSIYIPSLDQGFQMSSAVAVVRVEASEEARSGDRVCGKRYQATIVQSFKGRVGTEETAKILFGREPGLAEGHEYLLFAVQANAPNEVPMVFHEDNPFEQQIVDADRPPSPLELDYIACGMVPGLIWMWALPVDARGVLVSGVSYFHLPSSIHAEQISNDRWILPSAELYPYLTGLGNTAHP